MEKDVFCLIEASKLSLDDDFMKYNPKNIKEQKLKDELEVVIKKGIDDFWRPIMDPSIDNQGNICFKKGCLPAIGKTTSWWRSNAEKFNPMCKSRLGTKSQYIAFLGVLIKTLVGEGLTVEDAWIDVCSDSKRLGNYWNSENSKHALEVTGSRTIAGFCDLGNTCKILLGEESENEFWIAGGDCCDVSRDFPIASFGELCDPNYYLCRRVGWLVLS